VGTGTKVVGYVRVSTDEQADSGAGLEAQRQAIRTECERRGWELVGIEEDAASGKSINGRRGLRAAIVMLERKEADALLVAKLDRLSRSLMDFAGLMERAHRKGWALVALDLGVDTTTPQGEMMANVMATFAQFERRLIGQRTREALAIKKAQGVKLGRPTRVPLEVARRIQKERRRGRTLQQIADRLNSEGVGTTAGKMWQPTTVRRQLGRSLAA
jgi:DNA invertase Pin-like site-specific DNA recombinase